MHGDCEEQDGAAPLVNEAGSRQQPKKVSSGALMAPPAPALARAAALDSGSEQMPLLAAGWARQPPKHQHWFAAEVKDFLMDQFLQNRSSSTKARVNEQRAVEECCVRFAEQPELVPHAQQVKSLFSRWNRLEKEGKLVGDANGAAMAKEAAAVRRAAALASGAPGVDSEVQEEYVSDDEEDEWEESDDDAVAAAAVAASQR